MHWHLLMKYLIFPHPEIKLLSNVLFVLEDTPDSCSNMLFCCQIVWKWQNKQEEVEWLKTINVKKEDDKMISSLFWW